MKKTAWLLIICMLLPTITMTACSDTPEASSDKTAVNEAADDVTVQEEEEEANIYDEGLAAITTDGYGGAEFTVLTRDSEVFEEYAEELTGETTNDAIYNRNLNVENFCDIKLKIENAPEHDTLTRWVANSITAGDQLYDLIAQKDYKASELVSQTMCGNWLDIPAMNLDAPWWTTLANAESIINNKLFAITGDYCITSMLYLFVLFYNADAGEMNGITAESLQSSVLEGTWTIDSFNSLVKDLYIDSNGDGAADAKDFYGMSVCGDATLDAWLNAFDQKMIEVNAEGGLDVVFITEKTMDALEKVFALYNENTGTFNPGSWKTDECNNIFKNSNCIFTAGTLNSARNVFADVNFNLGILPYPKWNEEQDKYYSLASDCFSVLIFPINLPESEYEFLGTVTEALTIFTSRDVAPVFYDSALKGRYSMDRNTSEIVDLIMKGRRFDFAFQYGNQLQVAYMFRNEVINKTKNLASTYAKSEKLVNKNIEKVAANYGLE